MPAPIVSSFFIFYFAFCVLHLTQVSPPLTSVAIAPQNDRVIAVSQEGIHVYTWPDLKSTATHQNLPWSNVHDAAFSSDGQRLAIAGGAPTELGGIAIYQWPELKLERQLDLHDDVSYRVAWSAEDQWLSSAAGDRQVMLVPMDDSAQKRKLVGHSQPVMAITFVDSTTLVSAGVDHSLRVWSVPDGKLIRTLENHTRTVSDLALRPKVSDGPPIVASCGEDSTVRFWQPTIGRLLRFARVPSTPTCIAWTPDGSRLLAGCRDGHVRAIDPENVSIVGDYQAIDGWIYCLDVDGESAVVGGERGQIKRVEFHTNPTR